VQAVLVALTLVVVILRCWVRLRIENRKRLTLSDYLVWAGWFATVGWFICAVVSLNIQHSHPLKAPYTGTDSVAYLKVGVRPASLFCVTTKSLLIDRLYIVFLLRRRAVFSKIFTDSVLLVAHTVRISQAQGRCMGCDWIHGQCLHCIIFDRHVHRG
jgi:hypothetical protein